MLARTDVVDLIAESTQKVEGRIRYHLYCLVDEGEWELDDVLERLQNKINSYLGYVLDGQLLEEFPEAAGAIVRIVVQYVDHPPDRCATFLERLLAAVREHGVETLASRLGEPLV